MNAIEAKLNGRIQEIMGEMVNNLAEKYKIDAADILDDEETMSEVERQAQIQAKEEFAEELAANKKRREMEKWAAEARKREALGKIKESLGLKAGRDKPVLKVVESIPAINYDDCWREYVANNPEALPAFFCELKTAEEASACRGFLLREFGIWKNHTNWYETEALNVWLEKVGNIIAVITDFFKSINCRPPYASEDVYRNIMRRLKDEEGLEFITEGPWFFQKKMEDAEKAKLKAKEASEKARARKKKRDALEKEIRAIFVDCGHNANAADRLTKKVLKNCPSSVSAIEAIRMVAVDKQAKFMRGELSKNENKGNPLLVGESVLIFFLASGMTEKELISEARARVGTNRLSPKAAGEGKNKGNEKDNPKKTNKKRG